MIVPTPDAEPAYAAPSRINCAARDLLSWVAAAIAASDSSPVHRIRVSAAPRERAAALSSSRTAAYSAVADA